MTPLYCEKEKALESQEETPDSCSNTYASLIGLITGTRSLKQKKKVLTSIRLLKKVFF
jgi:hypothetical protein